MRRLYLSRAIVFVVAAIALSLLRAPTLHAQAATLTGTVTSETGQALENANAFITELNISVADKRARPIQHRHSRRACSRPDRHVAHSRHRSPRASEGADAASRLADERLPDEERHQSSSGSRRHRRDRRDGAEEDDLRRHVAQLRGRPPGQTGERPRVDRRQGSRRDRRRWQRTSGHGARRSCCAARTRSTRPVATRVRSSSSTAFCSTATAPTSIPKTSRASRS